VGGVPLTITPPLDEHQLDAEESGIGWKGIEPKVRAQTQMRCGAPRFLVWNSGTFSGAWLMLEIQGKRVDWLIRRQ